MKGIVECWNISKGFGFISYVQDDEICHIYTHYTQLLGAKKLKKYQYVRFDIGENERGKIATNVGVLHDGKDA